MKNVLIAMVAMVIAVSCMPAYSAELSIGGLWSAYGSEGGLAGYLIEIVITKIALNPLISVLLLGLSASMPLIGFIANRTKNPIDNAVMILINKILQTLAFNTSTNQPDVLPWKVMLSNKPYKWPELLVVKIAEDTVGIRERVFMSPG
jgi:hypothetical protein